MKRETKHKKHSHHHVDLLPRVDAEKENNPTPFLRPVSQCMRIQEKLHPGYNNAYNHKVPIAPHEHGSVQSITHSQLPHRFLHLAKHLAPVAILPLQP